jgi:hypothetical protein
MRTIGLLVTALAAAVTVPLAAQGAKAPMRISVTVVRSCTVSTDTPTVTVNCGKRQPQMQVTGGPVAPGSSQATRSTQPTTIEF